ncbi:SusC/RagA family TonB-linked outer membrane protein [Halpernia sp.]|uniref:SusC/RagA family TonB-linked outer membrane protein n=1 Tax=Halpernia sp. TaxID=2782209 RepID=UPI003A938D70
MKKLTTSVLAVVLSSTFVVANAQQKNDTVKTQDIEGVVVTALGIKREKKSLGYASQEIKADVLSDGTTNTGNIASQLSGKIAGLQVNTTNNFAGSANLLIRGVKSLQGGNPLIVIDGSPVNNSSTYSTASNVDYGNALSDINQDDIASINVLKGAAASALYGERGLNGVIVITTKNGRGKEDGSWGVTLSSSVQGGQIDKSTFPEYQNQYGGGYGGSTGNLANDFYTGTGPGGLYYVNFPEDASWGPKFDPNLQVYAWDYFDPTSPNYKKATPWVAAKNGPIKFFDTPFSFSNSISLDKGTKGKNISLSFDNLQQNGLMPGSKINKNTFSTKINYDLTDKLHASVFSTLTLQNTKGRATTNYSDNFLTGFREWWQVNVDVLQQKRAYEQSGHQNISWNRNSAADGTAIFWNNPYFQALENQTTDRRTRSFSYASVTYDISKNFSLMGKVSLDNSYLYAENRLAVGSIAQSFGQSGNGTSSGYARTNIEQNEINYDLLANYKFDITDKINVSGVLGGNVRRNYYNSIYNSTEGGLVVPGLYALGNSKGATLAPSESEQTTESNSLFATASFDFYKIFYLDGTYRVDRSSTLPKGNNVYGYPSVTGSLILSELIKPSWLSFWKVRANYAEVGGTASAYLTANQYASAGLFGNVGLFGNQTSLPNADLQPQRSKEIEVGTEVRILRDRVTLDVAAYKTNTTNQIIPSLPISVGSGLTAASVNAGEIENRGIEVQLGLIPIKSQNFTWEINANWSKNENKVITLLHNGVSDVSNYLLNSFQGGVSLNATEGEAWGALIGQDYQYINGQPVISATTGRYLKSADKHVIGNTTPDWVGGVRNSFNYKGFSLSFLIDVRHGGDIFSTDMYYGLATGLYPETAANGVRENGIVWPGVNPNGQVNQTVTANPSGFGSLDGYYRMPAARFVYDGSFVKLREASIGWTLPKSLLAGTFLTDAKISLVGRNLWIIHKNLPYADPEAVVGGGIRTYGLSIGSLPTTRDFGVNVTVKF